MGHSELFWNASVEELKLGYVRTEDHYISLLCGKSIEKGIIYPLDGVLYEAEKYMQIYIRKTHGSVFEYLTKLDKKLSGLTDHQNSMLRLFYQGKSDAEVQKELGIGSASTIRNHRFVLKEKERQSRVFLVLMELLKEKDDHAPAFVDLHQTAKMVDQRYNVTEAERKKILQKVFPDGLDGPLHTFDLQEKHRYVVLREIVQRFERERLYTEKEINEIIAPIYEDYAIIRRYMIEYGFMDRKDDGREYWLKH